MSLCPKSWHVLCWHDRLLPEIWKYGQCEFSLDVTWLRCYSLCSHLLPSKTSTLNHTYILHHLPSPLLPLPLHLTYSHHTHLAFFFLRSCSCSRPNMCALQRVVGTEKKYFSTCRNWYKRSICGRKTWVWSSRFQRVVTPWQQRFGISKEIQPRLAMHQSDLIPFYLSRGCFTLDCRTLRLDFNIQSFLLCVNFMPEFWILWAITVELNLLVLPQRGSLLCSLRAQASLHHIVLEVSEGGVKTILILLVEESGPVPFLILTTKHSALGCWPWVNNRLKSAYMILDIPSRMSYIRRAAF